MRIQNPMFSDAADTRDAQVGNNISHEQLKSAIGVAQAARQVAALTFYQFIKDRGGFTLLLGQTGVGLLFLAAGAGIAKREIKESFYEHMVLMIAPAVLLVLFIHFNVVKIGAKKIQTATQVLQAEEESCMSKSSPSIAMIFASIIPQFLAYAAEAVLFHDTNTTFRDNIKENMELCGLATAVSMAVGIFLFAAFALCCRGKKADQGERAPLLTSPGL